jgi:anti-sigma B factor antagonist
VVSRNSHEAASVRPRLGFGMDFGINVVPLDATTYVVEPHGVSGLASAPTFKAALDAVTIAPARCVVVDVDDVTFIDSTAIGVLLSTQRKLQAHDGKMIVVCNDPLIRRIFDITGLIDVLNVRPSRQEALAVVQELAAAR